MHPLDQLTEELSPKAKHAFEAYQIAFTDGDPTITVAELRNAITRIYGPVVDAELRAHFEERVRAVLPETPTKPDAEISASLTR